VVVYAGIRMRYSWDHYPDMDMISLGLPFKDHIHQMKELVSLLLKMEHGSFRKHSIEIIYFILLKK
jgi:hypothetical protein